jgi:hypothetical protein
MPVPEGFDYGMWLGPAPHAPYHKDRCLYKFRFVSDYSGGQTTNFGHHAIGVAMWALGLDETGPAEVWNKGAEWPRPGDLFDTATKVHFGCRFAGGLELECVTNPKSFGVRVEGDKGWIETNGRKTEARRPRLPSENRDRMRCACMTVRTTTATSSIAWRSRARIRPSPSRRAPRFVGVPSRQHRDETGREIRGMRRPAFASDGEAAKMLERPRRAPWGNA